MLPDSPAKPSTVEEQAFMAQLLEDSPAPVTPTRRYSPRKITRTPKHQLYSAGNIDLEKEVTGWDWEALSDYVPTPEKPCNPPRKTVQSEGEHQDTALPAQITSEYTPDLCTRCLVQTVGESWNNGMREKHILATSEPGLEPRYIVLRDDWVFTDMRTGDVLNIIGPFHILANGQKSITLTTLENLLIHHPDTLLTPSLLASAPNCQRKPLVTALVRALSPPTPSLVYGTVLHEVFQSCLQEGRWDAPWIEARVDSVLSASFGDLVRASVPLSTAKDEILRRAVGVETFGRRYIGDNPKREAVLSDTRAARGETALLAISSLHDVEEDIWSPTYGLRGKLDASVQAKIDRNQRSLSTHPAPFEIKTGRAVAGLEHRAQTMLYSLLMQDRYGEPVDLGLLYYTQSEEVISVPVTRHELRALIGVRNMIAEWMARRFRGSGQTALKDETPFLPPTINSEQLCGRCYALDACMLYRRAVENVTDEASQIADIYAEKTGHLSQSHADFFKAWERLIALEERDMMRFKKELWTLGADEREILGRCFADMVLDTSPITEGPINAGTSKIHKFTYRFRRRVGVDAESLLNGHMNVGDAVTVSVLPDVFALCRGFILELGPQHVVLGVDHALDVMVIHERLRQRSHHSGPNAKKPTIQISFRIDKDEFSAGMGRLRENLASLFYVGGDGIRLRLVVDLAPPIFDSRSELLGAVQASPYCRALARSLNAHQMLAVEKVLCSRDYTLILGMPGTGKTTVVAYLIQMLVETGKTVLLSAYTHSAVDTILAKLKDAKFGILRLGNIDKVHPSSRSYHLSTRRQPTTIEEFERQFMTPRVVVTTALSIDQCVRNRDARKGGLDVSLFRRLSEAHPHAVVELTQQYRMNSDIMLLSNKLIYGDRLNCGNQKVANQSLTMPDNSYIQQLHELCWMKELLLPSRKAVFVDTDLVPATESLVSDLVQNVTEAMLVRQFTECLLRSGIRAEQIGVVTLYRQQIKLLSHLLSSQPDIEILTADRSQGRDKDCIIMSMVRSNEEGIVGDLVKDWRRMNVAFTRARAKLIIFGSRTTLARTPLLESFFQLMEDEGWILQLPRGAHEIHAEALFPPESAHTKRGRQDSVGDQNNPKSEEQSGKRSPHGAGTNKRIRRSPDTGLLRGRPVLRDVFNDLT
ncbi:AAA domain-containing protein [Lactarius psammicola]|nr:AAA domain-containing protein [Lactarius psammicola]